MAPKSKKQIPKKSRKKKKDGDIVKIDAFAPEAVASARELYITSPDPISILKLTQRFKGAPGASKSNLEDYCKDEQWVLQRQEYRQNVHDDLVARSRPEAVKQRRKNLKARQLVVDVAVNSIVKRTKRGEEMSLTGASNAIARHAPILEDELMYTPLMPDKSDDEAPAETSPITDAEYEEIMAIPNNLNAARAEEDGETV